MSTFSLGSHSIPQLCTSGLDHVLFDRTTRTVKTVICLRGLKYRQRLSSVLLCRESSYILSRKSKLAEDRQHSENISGKDGSSTQRSFLGLGRESVRFMVCSLEYAIVEDV